MKKSLYWIDLIILIGSVISVIITFFRLGYSENLSNTKLLYHFVSFSLCMYMVHVTRENLK